ncbi:MAG: DUF434 domain-containing protein [Spirochaetales bacterium]|nr:DUF434 domain-containing protein [Spirochaetales bacterium]
MSMLNFYNAVKDYRFLKNNQYSEKSALALVGDRYRLTRVQRNCLLRGVVEKEKIQQRREKLVQPDMLACCRLGIDWLNVIITIEAYIKGVPLFLADDHVLRDCAAVHGSYRRSDISEKVIRGVLQAVIQVQPGFVEAVIDEPVSFSGKMKHDLQETIAAMRVEFPTVVTLAKSADFILKKFDGIVASSDSVVMDAAAGLVDLPRFVLSNMFSFRPPVLDEIIFKK